MLSFYKPSNSHSYPPHPSPPDPQTKKKTEYQLSKRDCSGAVQQLQAQAESFPAIGHILNHLTSPTWHRRHGWPAVKWTSSQPLALHNATVVVGWNPGLEPCLYITRCISNCWYTPEDEHVAPENWWFGSEEFPFPAGYSQLPAVNLPGCITFTPFQLVPICLSIQKKARNSYLYMFLVSKLSFLQNSNFRQTKILW